MNDNGQTFHCNCGGPVRVLSVGAVLHRCGHKGAPGTSYYDGRGEMVRYVRVTTNPSLTNGVSRYTWWVDWK